MILLRMRFPYEIVIFLCAMLVCGPTAFANTWNLNSTLTCDERDIVIDRLAEDTKVTVSAQTITVGDKFSVHWSRGRFPEREPVFLMLSFNKPVRVKGKNLYGLLPNAPAAFDISWERAHTRILIPYFGRGVPNSGKISVEPLFTSDVTIRWATVGYNGCTERSDTSNQGTYTLQAKASGKPVIVINDPDDPGNPSNVYANRDGTRHLQIYEGRFRLLDAASGDEILESVGTRPHFSPAGRYIVVLEGDYAGIYDAVDGKRFSDQNDGQYTNSSWDALIWSHDDSFALQIGPGYSAAVLYNFVAGASTSITSNGCRICGANVAKYRLDLENNSFLGEAYNEFNVRKLSGGAIIASFSPEITSGGRVNNRAVKRTLQDAKRWQGVTGFVRPASLKYSEEIALISPFPIDYSYSSDDSNQNQRISDGLNAYVSNQLELNQDSRIASTIRPSNQLAWQWRSIAIKSQNLNDVAVNSARLKRLNEFGLEFIIPIEVSDLNFYENLPEYRKGDSYESHDKKVEDAHRKVWDSISRTAGINANRFKIANGCGVYKDGEILGNFTEVWQWNYQGKKYWLTNFQCVDGSAAFQTPNTMLFTENFSMFANDFSVGVTLKEQLGSKFRPGLDFDNPQNNTGPSCGSILDACGFEVKVFDHLLLLYSSEARGYAIIDTNTGKLVTKQFGLPRGDLFNDILLTSDGKHAVSLQKDGSFFVNHLATSKTVLSGRYVDDEIIVWTDDGRYDATSEGAHFVAYRFPGRSGAYTAQQFENFLRVPGLAEKVMRGEYKRSPIEIMPPPVLRAKIDPSNGRIAFVAEAEASVAIASLNVFQDGLLTNTLDANGSSTSAKWSQSIDLLPGTKWFSLVAVDENNVASAPYSLELTKQSKPRNVHILAVGVNQYDFAVDDVIGDLEAAVADANLFTNAISNTSKDRFNLRTNRNLLDQAATPGGIISELESIVNSAAPGDTVAFFFAGHGVQGVDGKLYLATSKTNASDIEGTALAFDRIASTLSGSKARIVMFLDTCHSGLAGQGLFSTNDDVVGNVLEKIPSGIVVFSASKGRELALEDRVVGNGYFTQAFAEVIDSKRTEYDLNGNGAIELSELFRGVKGLVVDRVSSSQINFPSENVLTQTPWMARNRMVGDFALF